MFEAPIEIHENLQARMHIAISLADENDSDSELSVERTDSDAQSSDALFSRNPEGPINGSETRSSTTIETMEAEENFAYARGVWEASPPEYDGDVHGERVPRVLGLRIDDQVRQDCAMSPTTFGNDTQLATITELQRKYGVRAEGLSHPLEPTTLIGRKSSRLSEDEKRALVDERLAVTYIRSTMDLDSSETIHLRIFRAPVQPPHYHNYSTSLLTMSDNYDAAPRPIVFGEGLPLTFNFDFPLNDPAAAVRCATPEVPPGLAPRHADIPGLLLSLQDFPGQNEQTNVDDVDATMEEHAYSIREEAPLVITIPEAPGSAVSLADGIPRVNALVAAPLHRDYLPQSPVLPNAPLTMRNIADQLERLRIEEARLQLPDGTRPPTPYAIGFHINELAQTPALNSWPAFLREALEHKLPWYHNGGYLVPRGEDPQSSDRIKVPIRAASPPGYPHMMHDLAYADPTIFRSLSAPPTPDGAARSRTYTIELTSTRPPVHPRDFITVSHSPLPSPPLPPEGAPAMHREDTPPKVYISGGLWTYMLEELDRQGRRYIPLEREAEARVPGPVNIAMSSSRTGAGEQLPPVNRPASAPLFLPSPPGTYDSDSDCHESMVMSDSSSDSDESAEGTRSDIQQDLIYLKRVGDFTARSVRQVHVTNTKMYQLVRSRLEELDEAMSRLVEQTGSPARTRMRTLLATSSSRGRGMTFMTVRLRY
ncbi:hypothetical protein PUNSTDRAFT_139680 [Punctularia strigosozonata HHB-11173 SS5]|uniref:Uncharacterized protein n=1 Tax=Punctularia strigosozonata (strain HHB-11173) TaxID=741275 RepID=R7RZ95_PUNST|nr:uncharacterized protein PUNSTDRAFT_139680 [Punctularia strigosozonata HHB-11173 SS5]EIN03298.1 hypothetical protein PUNSTDRAFT_139680 [Punctularia strigosozonata HHB-11173 SS5]